MKNIFYILIATITCLSLTSCIGCDSGNYNSYTYDDQYWESVNREQRLKDAGLDGAAKIEQKKRLDYLQGGGYTSPTGNRQMNYQGSKEQEEHLRMMDAYGW